MKINTDNFNLGLLLFNGFLLLHSQDRFYGYLMIINLIVLFIGMFEFDDES